MKQIAPLPMSEERFSSLAEAYGADIANWPEAEQPAALTLAARSVTARDRLADAHRLDAALSLLKAPDRASEALRARILDRTMAFDDGPMPGRFPIWLARSAAIAATTAAGLYLGILLAPPGAPARGDLSLIEAALIAGEAPAFVLRNPWETE